jgi:hypothetical protein
LIVEDLSQRTRKLVGFIGALVSAVFLLSIVDAFVSGHLERKNTFRAFPGTNQYINGELQGPVEGIADLTYRSENPMVTVVFLQAGGRTWRGLLQVDPAAHEGETSLMVFHKHTVPDRETPRFRVLIFTNEAHYRASFPSVIWRFLGIPPWWVSVVTLPMAILSFGISYYLSGKRERGLARQSIAPITRMVRKGDQWELIVALGREDGIRAGDHLLLLDGDLRRVGEVVAIQVQAQESKVTLDVSEKVSPGHFVGKI